MGFFFYSPSESKDWFVKICFSPLSIFLAAAVKYFAAAPPWRLLSNINEWQNIAKKEFFYSSFFDKSAIYRYSNSRIFIAARRMGGERDRYFLAVRLKPHCLISAFAFNSFGSWHFRLSHCWKMRILEEFWNTQFIRFKKKWTCWDQCQEHRVGLMQS